MRRAIVLLALLVAGLTVACNSSERDTPKQSLAQTLAPQLSYLDADSSLAVAVDLRFQGDNWAQLRPLISRLLREYGSQADEGEVVPPNAEGALATLSSFVGLDFEKQVRPLLDGHLVIGTVLPPRQPGADAEESEPRTVLVFRSRRGNLRGVVERVLDGGRLESLEGYENVGVIEDGIAVVGKRTLIAAAGGPDDQEALIDALERAEQKRGLPSSALADAERDTGLGDPLVLATGDLSLAHQFVEGPNLERAREQVPYLGAISRMSAAVDLQDGELIARARVVTDAARLEEDELPLGPGGELELPVADGIRGASLDQSRTTTFAAQVVRSLFADSDFIAAVEATERDLGVRFEDEVLRQFDCPSVSVFEPGPAGSAGNFAARSCVRDPEAMRELLPKLAPRLPKILRTMEGLGSEGLLGLLLVAPDAPLTPGALSGLTSLGQIVVRPFSGGDDDEQLYEVTGLAAQPERLVYGMIGERFVVASDRDGARRAASLETESAGEPAASAVLVAPERMLDFLGGGELAPIATAVFGELEVSFRAEADATDAQARLPYED
ncbi:MAG TPA: hypothetical protein VES62_04215 [Thermoleophilaceae bacterium]|nr:hypothetical protein [Thermoleophilaceae bacterium]